MFSNNTQFNTFRDKISAAGYELRCLWSAHVSQSSKFDDVSLFAVYTTTADKPSKIGTIVIRDYGKDGFGLWLESQTANMDEDVAAIVGTVEPLK